MCFLEQHPQLLVTISHQVQRDQVSMNMCTASMPFFIISHRRTWDNTTVKAKRGGSSSHIMLRSSNDALQHIPGDALFGKRFTASLLTPPAGVPLIATYNWLFADYWMANNRCADTCHWATIDAKGRQRRSLYGRARAYNFTFSQPSDHLWSRFVLAHYWMITGHLGHFARRSTLCLITFTGVH